MPTDTPKLQRVQLTASEVTPISPPNEGRLVPIVRSHGHTASSAAPPRDQLLRLHQVESLTGCRKSTLYRMMAESKFPNSISITPRLVAWSETAVLQWIQERIGAASGSRAAKG